MLGLICVELSKGAQASIANVPVTGNFALTFEMLRLPKEQYTQPKFNCKMPMIVTVAIHLLATLGND